MNKEHKKQWEGRTRGCGKKKIQKKRDGKKKLVQGKGRMSTCGGVKKCKGGKNPLNKSRVGVTTKKKTERRKREEKNHQGTSGLTGLKKKGDEKKGSGGGK